jgi:hypothetical protein
MKKEKIIQSIINDSKKIFHNVKRIPWFLGSHAFLVILLLIMFDLLVGSYLYYQYIYLAQNKDPIKSRKQVILDEEGYQFVLDQWKKRQESFDNKQIVDVKDPFK